MTDAAERPVPADIVYAGEWSIEPTGSEESVTLSLRYPPSASNRSGSIALSKLGLTSAALAGSEHPVSFEIRREAGTFACLGAAEEGRGNGLFRFRPDPAYADAIAKTGVPPFTLRQQIVAGMFDLRLSLVNAVAAIGLRDVTFEQLMKLKIFRMTPESLIALHAAFPGERLDDIGALAMMNVTPEYVEALRRANVRGLSAENVSALRASGVNRDFIEGLAAKHRGPLSIDDVVRLNRTGP